MIKTQKNSAEITDKHGGKVRFVFSLQRPSLLEGISLSSGHLDMVQVGYTIRFSREPMLTKDASLILRSVSGSFGVVNVNEYVTIQAERCEPETTCRIEFSEMIELRPLE